MSEAGPAAWGFSDQGWTLARTAEIVRRRFGVDYPLAWLDLLLHRIGWSVQIPARKATERDESKIAAWKDEQWPVMKRGRRTWAPGSASKRGRSGPEAAQGPHTGRAGRRHAGAPAGEGVGCQGPRTGEEPAQVVLLGIDPELSEVLSNLTNAALFATCADRPDAEDAAVFTLRLLARDIQQLTAEVKELALRAPRPCAAALLIAAGDNPERLASEASFAALCGVSPVERYVWEDPQRRRLNRGKGFHRFLQDRKAVEIEAGFGVRLVCPVDEFNASRHVGDDSPAQLPPPTPERVAEFFDFLKARIATARKYGPAARDYAMFRTLCHAGLRSEEASLLDRPDVHFSRGPFGKLHVRFGKGARTSGPRPRWVPMLDGLDLVLHWFLDDVRGRVPRRGVGDQLAGVFGLLGSAGALSGSSR